MAALQEFCFRSVTNLALLDKERKLQYFEALRKLLEKQKIFYTRISLSDDEEAKSVKDQKTSENVSQEEEEILDKLKEKNLSPEDLKKIYEDLQKKK